jgi:Fe-S-cluster containining protein
MSDDAEVPCDGCTVCCRTGGVQLFPDRGDDVESYETATYFGRLCLQLRPDTNECIYLEKRGCTIYDRRPVVCREMDCRMYLAMYTRRDLRGLVSAGLDPRLVEAARRVKRRHGIPADVRKKFAEQKKKMEKKQ